MTYFMKISYTAAELSQFVISFDLDHWPWPVRSYNYLKFIILDISAKQFLITDRWIDEQVNRETFTKTIFFSSQVIKLQMQLSLTLVVVFRPDLVSRQVSGISTTSISRRSGRMMPTPQSARESVLQMAVGGFKTLVVRNSTFNCSVFGAG